MKVVSRAALIYTCTVGDDRNSSSESSSDEDSDVNILRPVFAQLSTRKVSAAMPGSISRTSAKKEDHSYGVHTAHPASSEHCDPLAH
jgi:hypothetical protein